MAWSGIIDQEPTRSMFRSKSVRRIVDPRDSPMSDEPIAGISSSAPVLEMSLAESERNLRVNLTGTFLR
jgi:hypothetical protein